MALIVTWRKQKELKWDNHYGHTSHHWCIYFRGISCNSQRFPALHIIVTNRTNHTSHHWRMLTNSINVFICREPLVRGSLHCTLLYSLCFKNCVFILLVTKHYCVLVSLWQVAHAFNLGDMYSKMFNATFLDQDNRLP